MTERQPSPGSSIEVSFCVVNTSQRELLLKGLDAIASERANLPFEVEVLVLDNGSLDGSAQAAREHPAVDEVIAVGERRGKALNDSELMARARGRYAMLLNEDSELLPGATLALHGALERDHRAACAGAALRRPDGTPQACAWRFPTPLSALVGALFLHRLLTVQSRGHEVRRVDWCQSSALLVRRAAAEQVGYMDPDFFVYSDEVDFARRLRDVGWLSLYVPEAVAIHHEQLATGAVPERRIVELARNRDLYMRKHHSAGAARAVRWLTAWTYAVRALGALALEAIRPGATGITPAPRCRPAAARVCARPPHGTTLRCRAADPRRRPPPPLPGQRARLCACGPRPARATA